jgi:hypothetical protein
MFAHNGPNPVPRQLFISVPGTQTPVCAALLVEIPALRKPVNPAKRSRGITRISAGPVAQPEHQARFSTERFAPYAYADTTASVKNDDIWLVSFMDYDLGYFDLETRVLEPLDKPFGPKLLPM